MKFCHWDGLETDQENLQDLSTKISVLTIKMRVWPWNWNGFWPWKMLTILSALECHIPWRVRNAKIGSSISTQGKWWRHGTLAKRLNMSSLHSLDPVPSSIRARNAQGINITNCDVTIWSWVNSGLVGVLVLFSVCLMFQTVCLLIQSFFSPIAVYNTWFWLWNASEWSRWVAR